MSVSEQSLDPLNLGRLPTLFFPYGERPAGTTQLPVAGFRTLLNPRLGTRGCYQACVRHLCTIKNETYHIHAQDEFKDLTMEEIIGLHKAMNFKAGLAYGSLTDGNYFKFQVICAPSEWPNTFLLWYLGHIYVIETPYGEVEQDRSKTVKHYLPNDIKGTCGGLVFKDVTKETQIDVATWFADHIDLPTFSEIAIHWTIKSKTGLRVPTPIAEGAVEFQEMEHVIEFYELVVPSWRSLIRYIGTTYEEMERMYQLIIDGQFENASWECVHPDVKLSTGETIYVWDYLNLDCVTGIPLSFKKKYAEEEEMRANQCRDMVVHKYFLPPGFQIEDAENKMRLYRHDYLANFSLRSVKARYESYCHQVKDDKFVFKTKNKVARKRQASRQEPSHVLTVDGIFKPLHIDHLVILSASNINVPLITNTLSGVVLPGAIHSMKLPNLGRTADELKNEIDNFEHRNGLEDPFYIVVSHRSFDDKYEELKKAKSRDDGKYPLMKLTIQGLSSKRICQVAFHALSMVYERLLDYYGLEYCNLPKKLCVPKRLVKYNWFVYTESDKIMITQTEMDETGSVNSEWDVESGTRFQLHEGEMTKQMKRHARVEKRQFSHHYDNIY